MLQIVALNAAVIWGEADAACLDFLTEDEEPLDPTQLDVSDDALSSLQGRFLLRSATVFQTQLRHQVRDADVDGRRELASAIVVPPVSVDRASLVAKALGGKTARKDRDLLLDIAAESANRTDLVNLDSIERRRLLEAAVTASLRGGRWGGAIDRDGMVRLRHPAPEDETEERDATSAVLAGVIKRLLGTSSDADLVESFAAILVVGHALVVADLFGDRFAEFEACPGINDLISALDEIHAEHGDQAVALISGRPSHAVKVDLRSGNNLVVRDLFTSDPYCVIKVTDPNLATAQERRTSTKMSTLRPVWHERTYVAVTQRAEVRVEVWDHDLLSADDPMGRITMEVSDLLRGVHADGWFPLLDTARGELDVAFHIKKLKHSGPPPLRPSIITKLTSRISAIALMPIASPDRDGL